MAALIGTHIHVHCFFFLLLNIIESVDSISRDGTDTLYI